MSQAANHSTRAPEFSSGYSAYVLGVLFVVYVFNFIDRQILAMLLDDIKADLEVSDTAMGLLVGLTFVVFYTAAGIPIARWADRGSRRNILSLAVVVWSAMTAACGMAQNFLQLALARIGVGIGEAGGTPPSHSMISDYFRPEKRATALSIYAQGIYVGAMIAFLAGGYIKEWFDWRTAFLAVGIPGLFLGVLVRFTVKDPTRGYWEETRAAPPTESVVDVARFLATRRSFVWLVVAASLQSISGYGFLSWTPAFLGRVHQMPGIEIGQWLGVAIGVGGSLGAFLGGWIGDRLGAKDARWYVFMAAFVSLAGIPFVVPFLLLEDASQALLFFVPFYILGAMYVGPLWSLTQSLVPARMRATASAILLFVLNVIGLGLGPFLVGLMNDRLSGEFGGEAIRYSLLAVAVIGAFASIFFMMASRTLRQDLARANT